MDEMERDEKVFAFFLLLTSFLLGASLVWALIGNWSWILAGIYAGSSVGAALTMLKGHRWHRKLILWAVLEACQIILCSIPLGIRAMF